MRACQQGCAPSGCFAPSGYGVQIHLLHLLSYALYMPLYLTPSRASARSCSSQRHMECVAYLLAAGADAHAQSSRGDNALHVAAKHGSAGCLHALLAHRPPGDNGSTALLGDVIVQGADGPTRFINLHNGAALLRGINKPLNPKIKKTVAAHRMVSYQPLQRPACSALRCLRTLHRRPCPW